MAYTVEIASGAYRVVKKLPRNIRGEIYTQAKRLGKNPHLGHQLKGEYSYLSSLHFTYKGTAYRIIYETSTDKKAVLIHLADTRENIYRQLKEMKVKPKLQER